MNKIWGYDHGCNFWGCNNNYGFYILFGMMVEH